MNFSSESIKAIKRINERLNVLERSGATATNLYRDLISRAETFGFTTTRKTKTIYIKGVAQEIEQLRLSTSPSQFKSKGQPIQIALESIERVTSFKKYLTKRKGESKQQAVQHAIEQAELESLIQNALDYAYSNANDEQAQNFKSTAQGVGLRRAYTSAELKAIATEINQRREQVFQQYIDNPSMNIAPSIFDKYGE